MEKKTIIGIDPGQKGFIVVDDGSHKEYFSIMENNLRDAALFLKNVKTLAEDNVVCCMEEVHALYGSSAKATFSFGEIFGTLQGILIALEIPYHLVQPKEWQKEIWINQDKVWKSTGRVNKNGQAIKTIEQKATSINAAMRLFPSEDFRRSPKCKKPDDNKCDAMLICEYGRRKNL